MRTSQGPLLISACLAWAASGATPVLASGGAHGEAQPYVSSPADAYSGFTALPEPRANVPVGALWVQGYGPHGEGATPENLETIRGPANLTSSKNLQVSLTLGLLNFLNIEPGLRNQVSARFSDLSVVRVKNLADLSGPPGEPRIYEALRAGSITITTEKNLSLNVGGRLAVPLAADGRGGAGRARSFTLEARDMFIAIRTVTPTVVRARQRELGLREESLLTTQMDEYRVQIDLRPLRTCIESARAADQLQTCQKDHPLGITVSRPSSGNASSVLVQETVLPSAVDSSVTIPLPVPLSDERGGLLTELVLELKLQLHSASIGREGQPKFGIDGASKISLALRGTRLEAMNEPSGRHW